MTVIAYIANMILATTIKLIVNMSAKIATKKIADTFHNTIKNSAAVMFHSITAKHAASKYQSIITHAKLIMSQNTHVKSAALTNHAITTSTFVSQHAQQIPVLNSANRFSFCQTGGSFCLSDSFFPLS